MLDRGTGATIATAQPAVKKTNGDLKAWAEAILIGLSACNMRLYGTVPYETCRGESI